MGEPCRNDPSGIRQGPEHRLEHRPGRSRVEELEQAARWTRPAAGRKPHGVMEPRGWLAGEHDKDEGARNDAR